jgi:hypothetical protein
MVERNLKAKRWEDKEIGTLSAKYPPTKPDMLEKKAAIVSHSTRVIVRMLRAPALLCD